MNYSWQRDSGRSFALSMRRNAPSRGLCDCAQGASRLGGTRRGSVREWILASRSDNRRKGAHAAARRGMPKLRQFAWLAGSASFKQLALLLIITFLMGGSTRSDIMSLIVLRPLSVLLLASGCWTLRREQWRDAPFLCGMAAVTVALLLLHLVPLPPALWQALPQREIIAALDRVTGVGAVWRPLSMAPSLTWNALFALAVPLAVLVHGLQVSHQELRRLMILTLVAGAASVLLGVLQTLGDADGGLYLYRASSRGTAVGLFANRNHQAVFLAALMPVLALLTTGHNTLARHRGRTLFLLFAAVAVLMVMLLLLGSRAGLVCGVVGLLSVAIMAGSRMNRMRERPRWIGAAIIGGFSIIAILIVVAVASGQATSVRHALNSSSNDDLRFLVWPIAWRAALALLPWGSGIGTYQPVFQLFESTGMLRSTYSNHAHSDWLEVVMTAGIPGVALLTAAVAGYVGALGRTWRQRRFPGTALAWTGLVIILLCGIGSTADYPLRAPIMSALFILACLWTRAGLVRTSPHGGEVLQRRAGSSNDLRA